MIPDRGYIAPSTKSIDETRHRFVEETQELIDACRHNHEIGHATNRKRIAERERLRKAVSELSDGSRDEIFSEFTWRYAMSDIDEDIEMLDPDKALQLWESLEMAIFAVPKPEPMEKPRKRLVRYVSKIFLFFQLPMSHGTDGDLAHYIELIQQRRSDDG